MFHHWSAVYEEPSQEAARHTERRVCALGLWLDREPRLGCSLMAGECLFMAISCGLNIEVFKVKTILIVLSCYLPFQLILTSVQRLHEM